MTVSSLVYELASVCLLIFTNVNDLFDGMFTSDCLSFYQKLALSQDIMMETLTLNCANASCHHSYAESSKAKKCVTHDAGVFCGGGLVVYLKMDGYGYGDVFSEAPSTYISVLYLDVANAHSCWNKAGRHHQSIFWLSGWSTRGMRGKG